MNNGSVYSKIRAFKDRYPITIAWRLKKHAKVIEKFLNPGEEVLYAFTAQKGEHFYEIINTYVVVLTNKRILLAQKRLIFGYFYSAITPDLFNDLKVDGGIIWGRVNIDTVKEMIQLSNIQKSALDEIETNISEYMMREKQKYVSDKESQ